MYVTRKNGPEETSDLSLRKMLSQFIEDNGIPEYYIAGEIGIHKETLANFIKGKSDLKFTHAIRLMKLLNLTERQFVIAYCKDVEVDEDYTIDKFNSLSYITRTFDIPTLKKIGIIKPRAKVDEYDKCICDFFGFSSIYEYDDTSFMPTLFSKSRHKVFQEKEAKMTKFWVNCAIRSFSKMGNPNGYDRELLIQLLKRAAEFTQNEENGYAKFVLVLYQLGVSVLTQSYISGTKSYGVTIILNGKPCIVITDMSKKYHNLWITLMHELYHVINDFEMLESMSYHISDPDRPELLLNEVKADEFALNVLINPSIQQELKKVISFPYKVKMLANEIGVSPCIVYGVYLESLPNGKKKSQEFAKYNNAKILISSDVATKKILFDPISNKSLQGAINKMKSELFRKVV